MFHRQVLRQDTKDYRQALRRCIFFFFRTIHLAGVMRGEALAAMNDAPTTAENPPHSASLAVRFGTLGERCPACNYREKCLSPDQPWIVSIDCCFQHWRFKHASRHTIPAYPSCIFINVPEADRATVSSAPDVHATQLCAHNFKAAGTKPSTMKKCDETGLISVVCRHDSVVAMLNMYAGERFEWILYGLDKSLEKLEEETGLRNPVILLYDVACKMEAFASTHRPDLDSRMRVAVNKFHGYAHELRCQKLYGVTQLKGAGESDGEGNERVWGTINGLATARRESSSPTKMLMVDDRLLFTSTRKRYNLARTLNARWLRATKNLQDTRKRLDVIFASPARIVRNFEGPEVEIMITEEILISEFQKQRDYFAHTATRKISAVKTIFDSLLLEKEIQQEYEDAAEEDHPAIQLRLRAQVDKTERLLRHHKQTREDWKEGGERWTSAAKGKHPSRKSFELLNAEVLHKAKRVQMESGKFRKRLNALESKTDSHLAKVGESRAEWARNGRKWKRYAYEAVILQLEQIYSDTLRAAAARTIELRNLKARCRGNKAAKKILASIMRRFPVIEKKIAEFNRVAAKLPQSKRPGLLTKDAFLPPLEELEISSVPKEDGTEALWKLEMIRSDLFDINPDDENESNGPGDANWPYCAAIRFGIDALHRRDRALEELDMIKVEWSRLLNFTIDRVSVIMEAMDKPEASTAFKDKECLLAFLWDELQGLECIENTIKTFSTIDNYFSSESISGLLASARLRLKLIVHPPPQPAPAPDGHIPEGVAPLTDPILNRDLQDLEGNGRGEDEEDQIERMLAGGDAFNEGVIGEALDVWAKSAEAIKIVDSDDEEEDFEDDDEEGGVFSDDEDHEFPY